MSHRYLLTAFVSALACSAAAGASAQDAVKLGFILPMTGQQQSTGKQEAAAIKLYMAQHGDTVAGKKVELIIRDDAAVPDNTKRIAQELIVNEKVTFLGGFGVTPAALSVAPLSAESKTPEIVTVAGTSIITEKSPYIARTSFTLAQSVVPMADWAADNGIKKVVTMISDYGPGIDAEKSFSAEFKKKGGEIVEAIRFPLASPDFAQFLVEEGAAIEAVDKALVDFGNAMGPLAVGDLAGLDVGWRIRKEYRHLEVPGIRQPFAEDRLCELGRFGQKTGAGWYKYDDQRRAIPDPTVDELVRKWVAEAGIVQRQIPADEITDRCIYALVNEGARILEEGYALRASDIDIIYLNGYGFPAHRGGPMWYADTVGLKKVLERVSEFHRQHGETWRPAPLLKRLAEQGKTFAQFGKEEGAAV